MFIRQKYHAFYYDNDLFNNELHELHEIYNAQPIRVIRAIRCYKKLRCS